MIEYCGLFINLIRTGTRRNPGYFASVCDINCEPKWASHLCSGRGAKKTAEALARNWIEEKKGVRCNSQ